MAILISGTTNDITINGVSVATDAEVSSAVAPLATTAYVDGKMVLSTAVTASGTAIDFTNIPSWVKRITVMFNGVSTNGGSTNQVQLGDSGGIESTGYISGSQIGSIASGFIVTINPAPSYSQIGELTLVKLSGNTWIQKGITLTQDVALQYISGSKTLSSTLDRIRITTVNGTDVFDAGQINIMYEG